MKLKQWAGFPLPTPFTTVLRFSALALMFSLSLWTSVSDAQSLAALDKIFMSAKNIDDFVENFAEAYFLAAQAYYGKDKFPKEEYYTILKQLRELIHSHPELAERIYETTDIGTAFQFSSTISDRGLDIDAAKWETVHSQWKTKLAQEATSVLNMPEKARLKWVKETYAKSENTLAAIEQKYPGTLTRTQMREKQGEILAVRKNPELRSANAYLAYKLAHRQDVDDALNSKDADLILDTLESLRPPSRQEIINLVGHESPAATFIEDFVPSASKLVQDKELFKPKMVETSGGPVARGKTSKATYDSVPSPRRFHTIFGGLPIGECVSTSLRRWAVSLLKRSQFYFVEEAGRFLGVTRGHPIVNDKGEIYSAWDYLVPALRNNAIVVDQETGKEIDATLFDIWFQEARKHLPSDWKGIVKSDSNAISNAGIPDVVFGSPYFVAGKNLGPSAHFHLLDTKTEELIKKVGPKTTLSDGLITDVSVISAGSLTELAPISLGVLVSDERLKAFWDNPQVDKNEVLGRILFAAKGEISPIAARIVKIALQEAGFERGTEERRIRLLAIGVLESYISSKLLKFKKNKETVKVNEDLLLMALSIALEDQSYQIQHLFEGFAWNGPIRELLSNALQSPEGLALISRVAKNYEQYKGSSNGWLVGVIVKAIADRKIATPAALQLVAMKAERLEDLGWLEGIVPKTDFLLTVARKFAEQDRDGMDAEEFLNFVRRRKTKDPEVHRLIAEGFAKRRSTDHSWLAFFNFFQENPVAHPRAREEIIRQLRAIAEKFTAIKGDSIHDIFLYERSLESAARSLAHAPLSAQENAEITSLFSKNRTAFDWFKDGSQELAAQIVLPSQKPPPAPVLKPLAPERDLLSEVNAEIRTQMDIYRRSQEHIKQLTAQVLAIPNTLANRQLVLDSVAHIRRLNEIDRQHLECVINMTQLMAKHYGQTR